MEFSWSLPHSVDGYGIYEFVSMSSGHSGGTVPVTTALIIELYMAVVLCIGGLQIIRTGMRANRQIKLHKSPSSIIVHLAGHIEDQTSTMQVAGFEMQPSLPGRSVKTGGVGHVANELDAEATVGSGFLWMRMAEGIVTLLGSVGVTIYQVVMGGRAWMS